MKLKHRDIVGALIIALPILLGIIAIVGVVCLSQ